MTREWPSEEVQIGGGEFLGRMIFDVRGNYIEDFQFPTL